MEAIMKLRQEPRVRVRPMVVYLIGLWVISAAGCRAVNGVEEASRDSFTVARDSERQTGHPRLYYTPKRLAELKRRISSEKQFKDAWETMLERADRYVGEKLVSKEYAEGGQGQHGNYGRPSKQMSGMGAALGLAFQMTGEEKYAKKLREAMLHYGKLNRWAGDAQQDPPWHSELNTARFCFGYGVGYDSIRDWLSESDRKVIVSSMVRLGILPTLDDWVLRDKRIHALDSMGHNWWSVCVAMAGVASLAVVGDEPRAERWVESVRDGFPEWFVYQGNILQNKSPNFDQAGAFYESVNYAEYAMSEYLLFHLAYTNLYGDDPLPGIDILKKSGDFFVNTCYPTSERLLPVNFGDSSLRASGSRTVRLLLANGFDAPQYHWYSSRVDSGLGDPIGLVYYALEPDSDAPSYLAKSAIYEDIGWATMRSSWEDDATFLAVKSGFAWNHAHPDAGSFILFHGGEPLIIDSGNCSYSRREYTSYYRQSKAHNVILHDGQAEHPESCGGPDRGVVHPGEVYHLMDLGGIKYVMADATGPTSWKFSRNYRHFVWVDDVILVFDDVRAHEEGQLEWLLHYEGEAVERESDIHLSNGESSRAIVRPLYPKGMKVTRKEGLKDHEPDEKVEYLALVPEGESREAKFITAIMPLAGSSKSSPAEVTLLEGDEMIGVRIRADGKVTEVFMNLRADGRRMHRNSNKVIYGWDTDAYIFATTRKEGAADDPDSVDRCLVVCGSYLRKNGKVMLDSLSKVYSVFDKSGDKLNVALQGQPIVNCSIRAAREPAGVNVNGEKREARWDSQSGTIRVRMSQ